MTSTKLAKGVIALTAAMLSMAALSNTTQAAGPEAREGRAGGWMMQRFDADGDGMISLQEFQAAGDAMFARLDADGDGRVSAEEWAAERAERMAQYRAARFANLDGDGDGYVSRAEFDNARMARFNALDVNGNGVIDADELPQGKGERRGYGERKGYGERERCRSK